MPVEKIKKVWTIECVQTVGEKNYPRIFAYMTKAERKKHLDALKDDPSFSCVHGFVHQILFPTPTRAERRVQRELEASARRQARTLARRAREIRIEQELAVSIRSPRLILR